MIIPDHYSTIRTPLQGFKQKAATQPSMLHRSNLFVEQWMKIINIKGFKQKAATQPSMLHRSNLFVEQWIKIINIKGFKQKAATQPSMLHRSNLFVEQWMKIINIKPHRGDLLFQTGYFFWQPMPGRSGDRV
jgi:ABC-type Fe2+-enterobactin transport system substrate-binding protein